MASKGGGPLAAELARGKNDRAPEPQLEDLGPVLDGEIPLPRSRAMVTIEARR